MINVQYTADIASGNARCFALCKCVPDPEPSSLSGNFTWGRRGCIMRQIEIGVFTVIDSESKIIFTQQMMQEPNVKQKKE